MYITLYARALNGKIKFWRIENEIEYLRIDHGYVGNKAITRLVKITMKTSDAQMMSAIKAKKKEGYKDINDIVTLSKHEINTNNVDYKWLDTNLPTSNLDANYNLKPMKCQKFRKGKMNYPAIAQPKLNGVRAVLRWETIVNGEGVFSTTTEKAVIRSKSGLIYHLPHITDGLTKDKFIDEDAGIMLAYDGELYIHGTPLNMINGASPLINDRGTIAKTKYPHITPQLKFVIFDISVEDMSQEYRTSLVANIPVLQSIDKLQETIVYSDDDVAEFTMKCINAGYEGAVIRDRDAEYKFGSRPISIMKSKKFLDGEFKVVDVIPKPKEPETALFVLQNDTNDNTFECNPMGTFEQRKDYLDNKQNYIGKFATVKYYERSGIKDVPFHANLVTIRDYE